jgi:hypothetical protein
MNPAGEGNYHKIQSVAKGSTKKSGKFSYCEVNSLTSLNYRGMTGLWRVESIIEIRNALGIQFQYKGLGPKDRDISVHC